MNEKRETREKKINLEQQSLADVIEMFYRSVWARLINGKTRWAFRENRSNLSLSSAVRFIISHDLDIYGWHFISLDRKISLSCRRHEDFWLSRNSRIARFFFWSCWLAIFAECKLNRNNYNWFRQIISCFNKSRLVTSHVIYITGFSSI